MHDLRSKVLTFLTKIDKDKNPLGSPIMNNTSNANTIIHYFYIETLLSFPGHELKWD